MLRELVAKAHPDRLGRAPRLHSRGVPSLQRPRTSPQKCPHTGTTIFLCFACLSSLLRYCSVALLERGFSALTYFLVSNVKVNAQLPRNLKRRVALGKQPEENGFPPGLKKCPRTILLGFSKGGVVLNQLLAELSHMEDVNANQSMLQPQGSFIRKSRKSEVSRIHEIVQFHTIASPYHAFQSPHI
jgi:hypothetical protein